MSLRLSDEELGAAEALKDPSETVQAYLRRLLRERARRRGIHVPAPRPAGRPAQGATIL